MYTNITKPWIDSMPVSSIQWLYNVLEGTSEPETLIYTLNEEESKTCAFTLRKDLKYHSGDLSTLY